MRTTQIRAALAAAVGTVSTVFCLAAMGQPDDPLSAPPNRVGGVDARFVAFTGATVRVDPDTTVTDATLVIRGGVIESVRQGGEAPAGARVVDARGLYIYPGFVDPFVEVDATRPDPASKGAHWNYHVMPQRRALDGKGIDEAAAESLRKLGFVAAGLSPRAGVFRGSGAAVSLAKPDGELVEPRPTVYNPLTYHTLSFEGTGDAPGGADGRWGGYPSSQMGAIALIRQTLLDAEFRQRRLGSGQDAGTASALDALAVTQQPRAAATASTKQPPLLFSVNDELEELRAWAIADEFARPSLVLGNGTEYKRLEAIAAHKTPLIVPLNYPEKPRVAGIGEAATVELRELMSWEQAPTNARRLKAAGVEFALTTGKLRDRGRFRENLRQAVRHGLSERDALAAVTVVPAALLGIGDRIGTIVEGKTASFFIADGPYFEKKTKLLDVYCDGVRHVINAPAAKVEGVYELVIDPPPPGEARRFLTIDAEGGLAVRRATKEEAKPEAKPEVKPDDKPGEAGAPKPDSPPDKTVDRAPPKPSDPPPPTPADPAATPAAPAADKPASPAWREKSTKAKSVVVMDDRISYVFDHEPIGGPKGVYTMGGLVVERDGKGRAATIKGDGTRATGEPFTWTAQRLPESDWIGAWRVSEFEGKPKAAKEKDQVKLEFSHGPEGLKLKLSFTKEKGEPVVMDGEEVKLENGVLTFRHSLKKLGGEGDSSDTLRMEGDPPVLTGEGVHPDGSRHVYKAERWKAEDDEAPVDVPDKLTGLPFGPYAREKLPEQLKTVVFVGGTVWTSGPDGKIEECDVVVQDGKIVEVGKGVAGRWTTAEPAPEGLLIVDCKGKHVTPGIIDCHSHTGISRGVNEGGQAVSAEVRVADVTNPDAISWYRQLAGGVTVVNNLHGSSNPIGGQNQVNKNRWGAPHPGDLHLDGAIGGIKFALGENVKGGNSTQEGWRYPQTRMGVETLIRDRLTAAREYAAAKKAGGPSFRRDLELDALAEILEGTRLIHCHSYRQDEILMLGRLAQEFGFKIGTFQHILEGYKVADIVRDSSGGGSCFSDWWAYKVEVQDAIPQGGPIMHEQGAVVSFNSDDDGMARRLNVEAAKGHKYSRLPDGTYSVSEEEALKFVTINPARQLRIDGRVGSIEKGKDADIAVWSGHPLSSLSRCERTFVDGRQQFSLEEDAKLRDRDGKERQRLIQKILADKGAVRPEGGTAAPGSGAPAGGGGGRRRPPTVLEMVLHDAQERRLERALDLLRRGRSEEDAAKGGGAGACGCDEIEIRSNK
ncbi:MAG TPA: amidohydrolase family protein [Phycisphaerales bacterium]|nr:amidohydrolase family protein [Phycisphaerales bacterium]